MPTLPLRSWILVGTTALAVAALGFSLARVQPVWAQFAAPPPLADFPVMPDGLPTLPVAAPGVQALDATHFVVITREPRLVRKASATSGPWQNMLLPVVTHYTVQGTRLVPIEHVRVPQGYRAYGQ